MRGPSPPPDYLRAMSSVNLNSELATPLPGSLDDIPGIPARDSRHTQSSLKGPWEPSDNYSNSELHGRHERAHLSL